MVAGPGGPGGEQNASLVRPFVGVGGGAGVPGEPTAGVRVDRAVRPFLVTSGRTVPATEMPLEAQVVITAQGRGARQWLSFEYRDLVSLCDEPLAVAEIAARMSMHLGVIRVLIKDLQQQGVLATFQPEDDEIDADTIMRVINGLRQRT